MFIVSINLEFVDLFICSYSRQL